MIFKIMVVFASTRSKQPSLSSRHQPSKPFGTFWTIKCDSGKHLWLWLLRKLWPRCVAAKRKKRSKAILKGIPCNMFLLFFVFVCFVLFSSVRFSFIRSQEEEEIKSLPQRSSSSDLLLVCFVCLFISLVCIVFLCSVILNFRLSSAFFFCLLLFGLFSSV